MILKSATLNMAAPPATGRKSIRPGRRVFISRVFISSLVALLLSAGCARQGASAENGTSPLVYVALGDSTGIGLGARNGGGYVERLFARIGQKRPGSTLFNLSAPAATAADVVGKQVTQPAVTRATLVTVCVGVNDLLRGHEAEQFARDYETLIAKLRQPGRLVVVANLPDVASAPAMKGAADESLRSRLLQFNKAIEDVARRHGARLVDLYKSGGEKSQLRPEFFSPDGLHPSDLGYARWAEEMWAVIEPAMQK